MAVLFRAEFAGSANTALTSYTPEVGSLANINSNLELDGAGYVRWDTAPNNAAVAADLSAAAADFVMAVTLRIDAGTGTRLPGVSFRADSGGTNQWYLHTTVTGGVVLVKTVSGADTVVDTYDTGVGAGNDIALTITAQGDAITVAYGGSEVMNNGNDGHAATETGMAFFLYCDSSSNTGYALISRIEVTAETGTTVTLVPDSTVSNTNWTAVGAATVHQALASGDSDYITASTSGAVTEVSLTDPSPSLDLTAASFTVRARLN